MTKGEQSRVFVVISRAAPKGTIVMAPPLIALENFMKLIPNQKEGDSLLFTDPPTGTLRTVVSQEEEGAATVAFADLETNSILVLCNSANTSSACSCTLL